MKERHVKAIDHDLAGCRTCGKVSQVLPEKGHCTRCRSRIYTRKIDSVENTLAMVFAAMALYIPSHLLPMITVTELGVAVDKTILAGMMAFWLEGAYPIAIVIFCASILIPILKMAALLWLCAAAKGMVHPSPGSLGRVYHITELLGRWSMMDIFVVGILVSLVQFGNYTSIVPQAGALAFGAVVMLTMFAAMNFDPRLLWDRLDHPDCKRKTAKKRRTPDSLPETNA